MRTRSLLLAGAAGILLATLSISHAQQAQTVPPKDAEQATKDVHARFLSGLPFSDRDDFEAASRGLVAPLPGGEIKNASGGVIWDMKTYQEFMTSETAPDTVNPSLWRQELLNNNAGLFKVTEGIHQIRGFDLSNMTIIEGETGLIIIDPLISTETAAAGLKLYHEKVNQKPVVAVIHSHSHVDHYGGVKGVISEDDVNSGKVKVYAPSGFLEHAVVENVYAGNAMSRRAQYMYGALVPKNARGQVGAGLGKTTSRGTVTLIPPTNIIGAKGEATQKVTIDGIDVEFQLTPGTEAPSEMNMFFPVLKALCAAENATHTLHNILTLRGAVVRDPLVWAKYLNDALHLYADKIDVVFAQHHWPTWGTDKIKTFLADQRDMYKYINDQTLRLLNTGLTPMEIAETLKTLPPAQAKKWYNRDYYGSMSHNVRAVYQRYLGFYDGNPANLDPLAPVEAGKHYVEYMGGADKVIAMARGSFKKGEFRWVAQVMNHVVFADPDNKDAKDLMADALEQIGYQTENGTWRSAMLMGAFELRNGVPQGTFSTASPDTIKAMTLDMFFNYMGIRLNGDKAAAIPETVYNWNFTDTNQQYAMTLRNAALTQREGEQDPQAAVTVTLTRAGLDDITLGKTTFQKEIAAGRIKLDGDGDKLTQLFGLLDTFEVMFNIVTP
ncbi:MAG: MBL fold metallo-hydrolase [Rhizobiales bacterium]|nr:MBL fold metallo-hydrolase [Hyphomicrobiales bacterium]